MKDKIIIGRKDKADLPSLHLHNVAVKIDSGAYSCSIHCESVEEVEVNGKFVLEVVFLDKEHPKYTSCSVGKCSNFICDSSIIHFLSFWKLQSANLVYMTSNMNQNSQTIKSILLFVPRMTQ